MEPRAAKACALCRLVMWHPMLVAALSLVASRRQTSKSKLCLSRAAWQGEAREDRQAGHANLSLAPVGNSAYSRYHVARYAPHGVLLSCLAYIP